MKIRISYSVEVSDTERRALRHAYGQTGLASREELKAFFQAMGDDNCVLEDYISDMNHENEKD